MRLTDLLALSHVPRWAIVAHSRPQSVADHSFRVAVIYYELCQRLLIPVSLDGLTYALFHDGPEAHSGDISGPFKRRVRGDVVRAETELTPWLEEGPPPTLNHVYLIKLADLIEAYTYITKYGQGVHASRVGYKLHSETMNYAALNHREMVTKLLTDILTEAGRGQ